MWSVGGEVKFIPATTDAKKGLERGLERATAAIGASQSLRQEWVSNKQDDAKNQKSRWIVDDTPYVAPTDRALDAHLKLEQLVPRRPGGGAEGGGNEGDGSDESDYGDSSDTDSLDAKIRKLQKAGKKRRARESGRGRSGGGSGDDDDDDEDRADRKRSRKESKKESKKKSKSVKESKKDSKKSKKSHSRSKKKSSKKSSKKRSSESEADSDSDSDGSDDSGSCRGGVSVVSGKKIKMKLEGSSKKDEAEEKRRQAYLRSLNAHINLNLLSKS